MSEPNKTTLTLDDILQKYETFNNEFKAPNVSQLSDNLKEVEAALEKIAKGKDGVLEGLMDAYGNRLDALESTDTEHNTTLAYHGKEVAKLPSMFDTVFTYAGNGGSMALKALNTTNYLVEQLEGFKNSVIKLGTNLDVVTTISIATPPEENPIVILIEEYNVNLPALSTEVKGEVSVGNDAPIYEFSADTITQKVLSFACPDNSEPFYIYNKGESDDKGEVHGEIIHMGCILSSLNCNYSDSNNAYIQKSGACFQYENAE